MRDRAIDTSGRGAVEIVVGGVGGGQLAELRMKSGQNIIGALLEREQRIALARELLRDFDQLPAPRLRALDGGLR